MEKQNNIKENSPHLKKQFSLNQTLGLKDNLEHMLKMKIINFMKDKTYTIRKTSKESKIK